MNDGGCRYRVDRPAHTEHEFQEQLGIPNAGDKSLMATIKANACAKYSCSKQCVAGFFVGLFPIVTWLRKYQRGWIAGDIVSGLTVGVVHIPQSLAFAILTGLAPVFGLYTSFYPVLIYTLMGTSRHISVGTFAVTSLMARTVVFRHYPPDPDDAADVQGNATFDTMNSTTSTPNDAGTAEETFSDIDLKRAGVAAAVTLIMGAFQLLFGIFRLGFITSYLSEPLIQGFTTGAAFHVVTSQVPLALGIKIKSYHGPLAFVYSWIDIFKNLPNVNVATLVISIICIALLTVGREINLRYKERLKMPIPTEVLVVIVSILASHFGRFKENFAVAVVDSVPTGLPPPRLPDVTVLGSVIGDGFALAVVGFAISVSLSKMYSIRHGYTIDSNQELVAYGAANFIPSFFLCFPTAAALARCEIQDNTGGNTQVVGIISFIIVLIVILVLGPVFEPLPRAVLGCIIIVGLFGIIAQLKNLKLFFKTSTMDFVIWVVTWLAVVLLGVDIGLLAGVVFAMLTVIARTQLPRFEILANIADTDIYRAEGKYQGQRELNGIIIVKMHTSLYYANKDFFRNKLLKAVGFDPEKVLTGRREKKKKELNERIRRSKTSDEETKQPEGSVPPATVNVSTSEALDSFVHSVIVDCSAFGFIDFVGGKVLTQLCQQFNGLGISFLLTNCNVDVRAQLMRSGFVDVAGKEATFLSVHDAVMHALHNSTHTVTAAL